MRAASTKSHPRQGPSDRERCSECRGGLVCHQEWEAWLSRRDEAEAEWVAAHGSAAGFAAPGDLLAELPDCDEEVECPTCGGTGLIVNNRRSRKGARQRTQHAPHRAA
jgi:hypothetical protein